MINLKKFFIFISIILLLFSINFKGYSETDLIEHMDMVIEVYDYEDNFIFSTARHVTKGDRYISQDNVEYVIQEVEEDTARAENKGEIELIDEEIGALPPIASETKSVGIFHTHNAESYTPEISAHGAGDVHEVGRVFKNSLEEHTVNAIQLENMHLPHDGGAYNRSRRTAEELIEQNVDAKFDIHRDAIPDESEYITEGNGEKRVLTRLVVGRQNPNREVNEQFARNLKAVSDNNNNMIRDIFFGQGDYNQSLHPRALLLEIGTHGNEKEEAKITATKLAEDVSLALYGGAEGEPIGQAGEARSAWTTIAWILGIFIFGVLGYLYINERSWEGVMNRIIEFFGREIFDRNKE